MWISPGGVSSSGVYRSLTLIKLLVCQDKKKRASIEARFFCRWDVYMKSRHLWMSDSGLGDAVDDRVGDLLVVTIDKLLQVNLDRAATSVGVISVAELIGRIVL